MNTISTQKNKQKIVVIIFFIVIGLIVVNSILFYTRFDLTSTKIFSISDATQEIVQNAEDTIFIDYYVTPKLKTATDQPLQMIDILQEYQSRSNGKVVFTERDTDNETNLQVAQSNELEQQQIQIVEKNQATYAVVYSGIIISYQDQKKVIPFFLESSAIEYQLTSKIQELLTNDVQVIGIMVLDDVFSDENTLGPLRQLFAGEHTLKSIEVDTEIDEDVDTLIVVGSKKITNDTAYYIDQFLMQGKGIYFAADTVSVDLSGSLGGKYHYDLLHKMIESYGLKIENTIVLDEYNKLIPLNTGRGIQTLQQYPMWLTVLGENVSKDSPITSRFAGLDLYWTSPLTVIKNNQYFTTLISSSKKSWTVSSVPMPPDLEKEEKDSEEFAPIYNLYPTPTQFLESRTPENSKQYDLTNSFLGPLTSAVEDKIITKPEDAEGYKKSTDLSRFIVTGSTYFLSYVSRVTNANYNLVFMSNASSWLSSDEKLLQIKSRTIKDYRLNKIPDPTKKNALIMVVQAWNMIFVPLVIIIIAITVLLLRRKTLLRKY